MSKHDKLLMIELDYELTEEENKGLQGGTPILTRNLVNNAYQLNYPTMDDKMAKQWRSVRRILREAIEDKQGFIILSSSDFDSLYDEVYKAKFPAGLAQISPYLYDELDIVKRRSIEEEEKVQKEMTRLKEAVSESKTDPLSEGEKDAVKNKLEEVLAANK